MALDQSRDFGRVMIIGQVYIQYAWRFLASSAPFAVNQGNYLHRQAPRAQRPANLSISHFFHCLRGSVALREIVTLLCAS